ncbi:unnamed protein product [Rangifer tarandus platyrhynchus]|uniref:Uncharacterized protein n=1 Tax=Rangifer tarandus platyrhynchus TaxID=3082113 RepID=A0AC59ZPZ2_RANTA
MASNFLLLAARGQAREEPWEPLRRRSGRWEEAACKGGTQGRRRAGGMHGARRLSGTRTPGQQGSRGSRRSQAPSCEVGGVGPEAVVQGSWLERRLGTRPSEPSGSYDRT